MKVIDLKKDLEILNEKTCVETTQDAIDFSMYELLCKASPLEAIVGLSSAIINLSDSYVANKQHVINILENVIAQIESDNIRNNGNKLN